MSKRILWILTISLSLSMLGLIVLQTLWINNAVELKDKQFQQLVNSTLNDVSDQVEHLYTSRSYNAELEKNVDAIEDINWNIYVETEDNIQFLIEDEAVADMETEPDSDSIVEIISDTIIVISDRGKGKSDTIKIARYHEQLNREKLERNIKEQELILKKVMKNMLLEGLDFEEWIKKEEFEKILQENFKNRSIDLPFEYSVVKGDMKEIYGSEGFSKTTDFYYYRLGLIKNGVDDKDTYLYLYFPGQRAQARSSLGMLSTSTIVLTLLMILLFSFALYVIFKQKRLSDVKNDFVNNMTHELKTPISTISLASQMLGDQSIPSERKNISHISNIIQTESKRLGYQVERVLQMAVLDQGHLVLKRAGTEMNELVSYVAQNFKIQVESQLGKLELHDESVNDVVYGDRVHLVNVLTNLLDNAVKYSREAPEINLRVFNSGNYYCVSVADKGIGISKENQKKVFDRFYRVSTGNVHDVKGFGLGLSYVKLIVEQHGGVISLSSEPGKGTIFEIRLPLYKES